MPVRMVNIVELRQVVEILDTIAPRRIVDRALNEAGVNRDLFRSGPGFVPYIIEAAIAETVARSLGERSLGAVIGQRFDYNGWGGFARYVLAAPDLSDALVRSRRAISLVHPGAGFGLRQSGDNLLFDYRSGLENIVGHRHLSEGSVFNITYAFRHFLGQHWRPEWIELAISSSRDEARLADLVGCEVRGGGRAVSIAIPMEALSAPNPSPVPAQETLTLEDLPALMGVRPPKTMTDMVRNVMHAQLVFGDLSEKSVAHRLSMGTRTLQRALMAEGVSYRELRNQMIQSRARALLSESTLGIDQIAESLGYSEPNSFRRAFRKWTGVSPGRFREEQRKAAQGRSRSSLGAA